MQDQCLGRRAARRVDGDPDLIGGHGGLQPQAQGAIGRSRPLDLDHLALLEPVAGHAAEEMHLAVVLIHQHGAEHHELLGPRVEVGKGHVVLTRLVHRHLNG